MLEDQNTPRGQCYTKDHPLQMHLQLEWGSKGASGTWARCKGLKEGPPGTWRIESRKGKKSQLRGQRDRNWGYSHLGSLLDHKYRGHSTETQEQWK